MFTDWHPLGAVLYRKWAVYENIKWVGKSLIDKEAEKSTVGRKFNSNNVNKLTFDDYIICGSSFGGPVAFISDIRSSSNIGNNKNNNNDGNLMIFTSAGNKLADVSLALEWGDHCEQVIVGVGWTDQEHLVICLQNGGIKIYDLNANMVTSFLLLELDATCHILECHFWGNGVAALTSDNALIIAEGLSSSDIYSKKPRIYSLRTGLGISRTFTAMAILSPLLSRSGLLEALIATSDNSILVVHESDSDNNSVVEDQLLQNKISAAISKISVAPNGRFIACYRRDGVLTVMSSTFTTKVLDFDTKSLSRPLEIAWCGEDSVCMYWRKIGVVMVGPYGDWLNFPYDGEPVHLVAEPDCCRIITPRSCEILQRVPASTVAIKSVGSTDPAALMFDAMEAFEEGDPKSDENIRSIALSNQLLDSVSSCISAASAEFDISTQQSFLKAASYGKAFCPDADPTEFVETANKLRVLNDVRSPLIGLPITIQQYNRLTPEVLIGRLTVRNNHFLALKICELLKLRNERVLVHWACEKVRRMASATTSSSSSSSTFNTYTDEDINKVIKKQLEPYGNISYLAIAETAYSVGRRRLATFILDKEKNPIDQIPLLLRMNEEELALQKAINSEDTDLIYYTLISLESRIPSADTELRIGLKESMELFYKTIHTHLEAANLLKIYYRNKVTLTDRSILHHLLMYKKNYFEAGAAAMNQALLQPSVISKIQYLKEASQLFAQGKDGNFYKSITDDEIELLEIQKSIETRILSRKVFVNLSLMETIKELIVLGLEDNEVRWTDQEIVKIMKRFKPSEKSFYHIKIQCLCNKGEWQLLNKFANEKKSPIGYKAFASMSIKFSRPESETEKYIEKITDNEERYDLFRTVKQWKRATEVATKLKDPYKLQDIARNCQDPSLERQIQDILTKI